MKIDRPTFWTLLGLTASCYLAGSTGNNLYAVPAAWFAIAYIWDGIK